MEVKKPVGGVKLHRPKSTDLAKHQEQPPLPQPKYGLLKPQPLNYQRDNLPIATEKNSQEERNPLPSTTAPTEEDADTSHKAAQKITRIQQSTAPTNYAPGYQEHYQPAQGQSRLGRDIQTGKHVDVPQASRRQGLYVIGASGTGKSGLIENLIIQDIKHGLGVGLLDPHGDLTDAVLSRLPDTRVVDGVKRAIEEDVILLDITAYQYPFGLNLFACPDPTNPIALQRTVDQVYHVFEKIYGVSRDTPLILQYLRNCTHTLVANPGYTLADIPLLLTDKNCRQTLLANVKSPQVQLFWRDYDEMPSSERRIERGNILRRVEEFLQDLTFSIVGQAQSTIDLRWVMDERKILLVRLDATLESVTSLIGSLIIAQFLNAAYSRSDLPVNKRKQFNLYADEFQRFATEDFSTLLAEARKFGIATTIAHQFRDQLDQKNRGATLTVPNLVVLGVNPEDAAELAGKFDITPQEAWEEELEEERLEVLEPEWIETKEVIDGEEPIKVNERQIVDHLLKQGHEDERVMQFVRTYLQPFFLTIEKNEKKPLEWYEKSSQKSIAQKAFVDLNIWLYEGMVNPDKLFLPLPESVVGLTQLLTSTSIKEDDPFYKFWCSKGIYESSGYDTYNTEVVKAVRPATEEWQEERIKTLDQLKEAVLTLSPQQSEDFYAIRRSLLTQPQLISLYHNAVNKRSLYEADRKIIKIMDEWEKGIKEGGGRNWREIAARDYGVEPKPYQSQSEFSRILVVEMRVKYLPEIMRVISEAYFSFERFSEAAQLCQYALWQNPLMTTDSGLYQPRKRQQIIVHHEKTFQHPRIAIMHPQRTYADMLNEVASELTNLPIFTARIKITSDKQILEHTIRTLDPERGIGGTALQERIANIQKQNIKSGYLRELATVEEEIRIRQEQCSQPPQEPPISRRQQR